MPPSRVTAGTNEDGKGYPGKAVSDTPHDFMPIKLRSYQNEMFERSLEGNSIIVMETGSGKTAVAIYRMMHALEKMEANKLIWFLTPSVALCRQQCCAVQRAIPNAITRTIVGEDGPDLWGSQSTWNEVLRGVDIVFSTFAVLHDALAHAFVQMARLDLLIFDEAHHVTKNHPSNMIMRHFYHERRLENNTASLPTIIGLTASPSQDGKAENLRNLEVNLAAVCRTPRERRPELRQYVYRPSLKRLEYSQLTDLVLSQAINSMLSEAPEATSTKVQETVGKIKMKTLHLIEELGLWAALTFVKDLVLVLEDKVHLETSGHTAPSRHSKRSILEYLRPLLERMATIHTGYLQLHDDQIHISTKAKCFIDHLNRILDRQQEDFVGIVFVRQRVVTAMLERLLACHPDVTNKLRSGAFVGESNTLSFEKGLWELVVPRTQSSTLNDFRVGKRNLIVATDALDEGIDVAECNTIICFDPPKNLRSFIQKRGRARKKESTYAIMVPKGCPAMSPEQFEEMESLMSQIIEQESSEAQIAHENEAADKHVGYRLQSKQTDAKLTAEMMRQHLEHFCNKLPKPLYAVIRPEFKLEDIGGGLIVAEVRLPMSVPPLARTATSQKAWRSERAAIKDAAFQAYKGLYECGLLTEHLLPVDNRPVFDEDYKEQRARFHHLGGRVCVWDQPVSGSQPSCLFRTTIVIRENATEETIARLAFWTYKNISSVGVFELFAAENQVLTVEWQNSLSVTVDMEGAFDALSSCTRLMIMAARAGMPPDSDAEFIVFITPDLRLDELQLWLDHFSGEVPAQHFYDVRGTDVRGLVVNACLGKSLHIFRGWYHEKDEVGNRVLKIACSPFPRRRNFLKVRPSHRGAAQGEMEIGEDDFADVSLYDAEDCLIRLQPIEYAWAMRLVPSVFYHVEMFLVGERLQQEMFPHLAFANLSELVQAITSPATMLQDNYERLEFLGDSLLKFHTTQQLFYDNPQWHEEYLTRQRNTIISNISLAKAAVAKGIDRFIIQEPFIGKKWSVPDTKSIAKQADAVRHLRMKTVADVIESLIGAAFLGGGMVSARLCMSIMLSDVREEVGAGDTATPVSHSDGYESDSNRLLERAERTVGKSFTRRHLLLEALTHPSCTRDAATEPYQRLEFLGDAVLDHLVVTDMFRMLPHGSQSLMTKIKAALVNGDFLAFLCYSCDEVVEGVTYTASREEPGQRQVVEQSQGLWMMMRYGADAVADARQEGVERFESLRHRISNILDSGKAYPWEELCMLRAPKFISDIVESIIGAIYVDSNGDLEPCSAFLERIGLLRHLRRIVTDRVDVTHPKERLSRLLRGRKMEYCWDDLSLSMFVDGEAVACVPRYSSKAEAVIRATNLACKHLEGEPAS